MLSDVVSALHVLALAVGLPSVFFRGRALAAPLNEAGRRQLALLAVILILEIWPMTTIMRWRRACRRGQTPVTACARRLYVINHVQMGLVVLMVFVASLMARGVGLR